MKLRFLKMVFCGQEGSQDISLWLVGIISPDIPNWSKSYFFKGSTWTVLELRGRYYSYSYFL